MSIDEIEQLMKDGKIAEADAAAKELSEREPGNLRAKMLYGTCRQLLGDEETFRRIHDELAPEMDVRQKKVIDSEESNSWERYEKLFCSQDQNALCMKGRPIIMEYVVIAILILLAVVTGVCYFGKQILDQFNCMALYRGAERSPLAIEERQTQRLAEKEASGETNKTSILPQHDELKKSASDIEEK